MRARPACFAALTAGILLLSPPVDARAQSADTTPADEIVSYDVTVRAAAGSRPRPAQGATVVRGPRPSRGGRRR